MKRIRQWFIDLLREAFEPQTEALQEINIALMEIHKELVDIHLELVRQAPKPAEMRMSMVRPLQPLGSGSSVYTVHDE